MLGAAALALAPAANADQSVVADGHKGNPPGNNGTVKIEGVDIQSKPPDNNPHQGCSFVVEFYNYDKNDNYLATVTFEDQAPTADAGLQVALATCIRSSARMRPAAATTWTPRRRTP